MSETCSMPGQTNACRIPITEAQRIRVLKVLFFNRKIAISSILEK
jgi:hypothetical protein